MKLRRHHKPPVGYPIAMKATPYPHDWIRRGMGIWACWGCSTQIQMLPNGLSPDCRHCRKPGGGVHPGPKGWWHVTNGTFSDFTTTEREAYELFQYAAQAGLMEVDVPPPPARGCDAVLSWASLWLSVNPLTSSVNPVGNRTRPENWFCI